MNAPKVLLTGLSAGTLAAAGFAAAGCGASATVGHAVDPVAQAAEVTQQQPGARVRFSEQMSGAALPQAVSFSGTGFINLRQHAGELTFDLSGMPSVSSAGGGTTAVMVFKYPAVYAKIGALSGKIPGGRTWLKIDLQKAAQAGGIDLSQLATGGGSDPSQFVALLRGIGNVTRVGTEVVNGVSTTHYKAVLHLSRVADRLPPSERAAAQANVRAIEKVAGDSLPVEVWVDAQNRVRREQFDEHVNLPLGAGALTGRIAVDFLSFGPTPSVSAPPAGEVWDATSVTANGVKQAFGSG